MERRTTSIDAATTAHGMCRSFTELRQELRNALDEIVGYGEVMADVPPGQAGTEMSRAIGELTTLAVSLSAAIDASAPHPTARYLVRLGERLLHLGDRMCQRVADLMAATPSVSPQVMCDLERLATACRRISVLAASVLADPAAIASPDPSPPADVTALASGDPAHGEPARGVVLIVDDNEENRHLLARRVGREGYATLRAGSGYEAIECLRTTPADLVLLDVLMPEMNGVEVLQHLKRDPQLHDIPVIMISAVDDVPIVASCIASGADDYLSKPFDPVILRARLRSCIERRQLRLSEKRRTAELEMALAEVEEQRTRSENLLLNILPRTVAEELRIKRSVEPMYFEDVTILFADIVGFTVSTEAMSAEDLVWRLHEYVTGFDRIVARYGLEKLKTIGDSYMCVGGLPERTPSHPVDTVMAAMELVEFASQMRSADERLGWPIRVGIHTGPVIAGVVGIHKFAFDIFGETVNFASRMESASEPNCINLSERTYARIKDFFDCIPRGKLKTKERRRAEMYFARGISPGLLTEPHSTSEPFVRRYRIYFKKDPPALPAHVFSRRPPHQAP